MLPAESYEVIVVDNNSPVGIAAVRDLAGSQARVITETEQGAGPARNAGAAVAAGDVLAFLDSDCRPAADWLVEALNSMAQASIAGGRVDLAAREPHRLTAVEAFEFVFSFDNQDYVERKNFSVTANLVVRRDVFHDVGPFRNHVSEDSEWGQRAAAKGYSIQYNGAMVVTHPSRHTWAELVRKWDRLVRESYLLMQERPFGTSRWVLRAFVVLLSPAPHTFKILKSPRLDNYQDRLKATVVLFRIRFYRFRKAIHLALSHCQRRRQVDERGTAVG